MKSKARILFVDDEKKFTEAMVHVLSLKGYDVQPSYSGKLALELFVPGEFDLVITDLNMPEMDGIEFIREVRKLNPYQRIIVVTGFPSQRSQEQAFRLGTLNYIAKPFKTERFIELVKEALEDDEEGLFGAMRLSPSDLIQLCSYMGRTVILEINKGEGDETGRIYFNRGQVVHAEAGGKKGKDAFYEIQSWQSGVFRTEMPMSTIPQTIEDGVDALLLEGARRQDEHRKSTKKNRGAGDERS